MEFYYQSSQNGTLYHSWEWLKVIEKNSDCKLYPLVFFDAKDNQPFGAIPIFFKKKFGLKLIFSPPPGSSVTLGPVIINKRYKQHKFELAYLGFQKGFEDFIQKFGADSIHITTSPGLYDMRPFSWAHYQVSPFYTYKIDLKQGANAVWSNMSQSLKTNIKKAPTRGITAYESADIQALECVYELVAQRYQQQRRGLPMKFNYLKICLIYLK
jgi:lipid II:glycine glycyltransferase (peptidoglycan interpeptide bridge formation enzyme)